MRRDTHTDETPDQGHCERNPGAESPVSRQKLTYGAFAGALVGLLLFLAVGCRTFVAQQIVLTIPDEATEQLRVLRISQTMYGCELSCEQGKQIPVQTLTDLAVSASQNGNASSSREGGHSTDTKGR